MTTQFDAAVGEWQTLLGSDNVLLGLAAQAAYGADTTAAQARPIPAGLRIADSAALPEVMRIASRNLIAVHPISTGRNWGYGTTEALREEFAIIDLSGLNRILDFDPDMGVVTVEPGVTQGMLAAYLDKEKLPFMVPVTGAGPSCSLLGNALERGYGITPYTDHFAAVTDLEAILVDGSRYRTAMNEAAGDDLARLFKWGIGAYSAGLFSQSGFGIVTRMSIQLARRPECTKVCLFSLKDDALLESAVERIRTILGKLPGTVGGINLMNRHRVLAMSAPYPADRIGDNGLILPEAIEQLGRQYQIMPWTGFGTLYGTKRMVAAAQKEIRQALSGVASRLLFLNAKNADTLLAAARWIPGAAGQRLSSTAATLARSLELVSGRPNETALPLAYWRNPGAAQSSPRDPARDGCGLIWYAPLVPMRPADARAYVNMVTEVTSKHEMEPLLTFTSLSDKLFDSTVPLIFARDKTDSAKAAQACYHELIERGHAQGCFPYRVAVGAMPKLADRMKESNNFHQRLRQGIDPHGLIAPGRYR
ncbi:MAG: FAD-linked oxidase [Collimonas fungivorans]|jgi:4-cresol dehydrogenase (hydroxylating)|uniref:FAD-binding oxidoreductase n=1 Tax=Collimonas fungivorans TaxID=158899 RepID=UPI0026EA54C9|nr:FAD-binding oxidoreductase [Collimonas fungivorans]MDB5766172.1 FAD-linked oxidase [Collimonas fungivorans]